MKLLSLVMCAAALSGIMGCFLQKPVYYVSPYNANASSYHAMPLKSDSVKTATYASANFYIGTANSEQSDEIVGFAGSVYQARRFGNFQAYYGGDLSIGNYKASNAMPDNKLFAGIGASGGINLFHAYDWGDWRIIGAEFTAHAESGAYSRFRKELPSDAADVIARSHAFSTAGLTTEVTIKTASGCFGFHVAGGLTVGNGYGHIYALDFTTQEYRHLRYDYATFTFQETFHRWTGYAQINTGKYAQGGRFGAVYRLGKR